MLMCGLGEFITQVTSICLKNLKYLKSANKTCLNYLVCILNGSYPSEDTNEKNTGSVLSRYMLL